MAYRLIRAPQTIIYESTPYSPVCSEYFGWGEPYLIPGIFQISTDATGIRVVPESGTLIYSTKTSSIWLDPLVQNWQWIAGATTPQPAVQTVVVVGESGWSGGGRTYRRLKGDGDFSFKLSDSAGAIAGLAQTEYGYSFSVVDYGWYNHGGRLDVIESGSPVFTLASALPGTFSNMKVGVRRRGFVVSYTVENSVVYTSSKPSFGDLIGIGIPYSIADSVTVIGLEDYIQISLPASPVMRLSATGGSELSMRSASRFTFEMSISTVLDAKSQSAIKLLGGSGGELIFSAGAAMALSAEPALSVKLLSMHARATAGFSMVEVGQAFDFFPEAQGSIQLFGVHAGQLNAQVRLNPYLFFNGYDIRNAPSLSITTVTDHSQLDSPSKLRGIDSLDVSASSSLDFAPAMVGNSNLGLEASVSLDVMEPLRGSDGLSLVGFVQLSSSLYLLSSNQVVAASFSELELIPPLSGFDGLAASDTAVLEQGSLFYVLDALELVSFAGLSFEVNLSTLSGLTVSSVSSLQAVIELTSFESLIFYSGLEFEHEQATQYAVNLVTGAVSTYQGAGFQGYVRAAHADFGWRADGLYRMGIPNEAEGISARVDLGTLLLGSDQIKHVVTAWLGLRTDASQVRLILSSDDGTTRSYVVRGVDTAYRAVLSKGAIGRLWHVSLELDDARYAVLDDMDFEVLSSQRRRR